MILSLQTTTFGWHGGIPTYNRLICRALNDLNLAERNCVLVAMDKQEQAAKHAPAYPRLEIKGFEGNRRQFVKSVLGLAAREKIELFLIGHTNYAPLGMALKRLQPRIKIGVFIYGFEVWGKMPFLRRQALRQADFAVSISDYTKQQAVEINKVEGARVSILPNALEWSVDESNDVVEQGILPRGTKLLSVGRLDALEQRKGFDTVIEALPSIAAEVPDVQYIIIGEGTDLERHRQLALKMGVSERVHLLGSVDEATLRHAYKACDVFVMPSAQEGFGFVYLEAMAYGKPIVAANSGGVPEVVYDGVNGLLVPYGDVEKLGRALATFCLDPLMRRKFGEAGYDLLQQKFVYERFRQTFADILRGELSSSAIYKARRRKAAGIVQAG